jgi:hypothetical protein
MQRTGPCICVPYCFLFFEWRLLFRLVVRPLAAAVEVSAASVRRQPTDARGKPPVKTPRGTSPGGGRASPRG